MGLLGELYWPLPSISFMMCSLVRMFMRVLGKVHSAGVLGMILLMVLLGRILSLGLLGMIFRVRVLGKMVLRMILRVRVLGKMVLSEMGVRPILL